MQVKVLEIPGGVDLKEFAAFLWRQQIPHRIRFNEGQQELWLNNPQDADFVKDAFQAWQQGGLWQEQGEHITRPKRTGLLVQSLSQVPITATLTDRGA